ncbi:MFS transporter [Thermopolyspora flexuosa]|nr:MFS transporter [Thermopolyspora flexuosa]
MFTAAFVGTSLEWYADHVFAVAAALVFGDLFFPRFDAIAAALATFATFAAGFLARPLGAALVGRFGDRAGRKPMIILTLMLTGGSTFLIGVLPTYAAIGVAAPVLLVLLRVVQGLGVSGEWGGAVLIATEHAAPGRRALWGSFAQFGWPIGVLTSNLAFLAAALLPEDDFLSYGWRVPFLLSAVLIVLGFRARLRLPESPEFTRLRRTGNVADAPLRELLGGHRRNLVLGAIAATAPPAFGHLVTVYLLSHGTQQAGFERGTLLALILLSTLLWAAAILGAARLADRVGPRTVYLAGSACAVLWPVPMVALIDTGELGPAIAAFGVAAIVQGVPAGALGALFAGMFEARVRYSGISIAYAVGGVIGGAVTPLAGSALTLAFGSATPVAVYVAGLAAASLAAVLAVRAAGNATWAGPGASRPRAATPLRAVFRLRDRGRA